MLKREEKGRLSRPLVELGVARWLLWLPCCLDMPSLRTVFGFSDTVGPPFVMTATAGLLVSLSPLCKVPVPQPLLAKQTSPQVLLQTK